MPRYIGRNLDTEINVPSGDPYWNDVSLLINCNGGSIADVSRHAATVGTQGDPTASSTLPKFGTHSINLDGTGDYLTLPTSSNLDIQTGDWTMEFWLKLGGTWSTATQIAFGQGDDTSDYWHISNHWSTTSDIYFAVRDGGSSWVTSVVSDAGAVNQSDSSWHHYAFCNASNTLRIFKNGTQIGSGAFTGNTDITNNFFIGAGRTPGITIAAQNHYIDDFRLTKGVARYTSNFTVPDQTFILAGSGYDGGHTDNKYNSGIWSISGGGDDSINTRRRSGKWPDNLSSVLSRQTQYQFLIVGGGGSGGGKNYHAGGGGAGGMLTGTLGLGVGETLTVTVGAGGAAASTSTQGNAGANSVVSNPTMTTATALGGGGGARGYGPSGAPSTRDGGSGGGGGGNSGASMTSESYLGGDGNQPAPTPAWTGYGNDGGDNQYGASQNPYGAGGGGGAGAVGGHAGPNGVTGAGGAGYASSITGSSVTYAGGGGGSAYAANGGAGGAGGGGQGEGNQGSAINGTANLGGGGGGNERDGNAGAGGSGVVIVRMLTSKYTGTISGTTTVTTSGSDTIVKFTAPGTLLT